MAREKQTKDGPVQQMNKMARNTPEHMRVYDKIRDMVLFGDLVPSQPVTILGLIDSVGAGMTHPS